jgi:acetoin utilization deacetylase AcuC-like enzyme
MLFFVIVFMLYIAHHPIYAHPLPEGHRFPMEKYVLIPMQLEYEGVITQENIFTPELCPIETVLLTHTKPYVDKLLQQTLTTKEQREIGFPQSQALTKREFIITQGTIDCCFYAYKYGISLNVAGGTHHAFADKGEGFCLLNDVAVASNYLLHKKLADCILIVDLDVHQGNGTASIFKNNPNVFTFSMHGQHNYPFRKEASSLDIGLADGTTTEVYLQILETHVEPLIKKIQPNIIMYIAGVDILETDKFGKLSISKQGCAKRDEMVLALSKHYKTPTVVSMGGGYSADIRVIVDAHCNTYKLASNYLFTP